MKRLIQRLFTKCEWCMIMALASWVMGHGSWPRPGSGLARPWSGHGWWRRADKPSGPTDPRVQKPWDLKVLRHSPWQNHGQARARSPQEECAMIHSLCMSKKSLTMNGSINSLVKKMRSWYSVTFRLVKSSGPSCYHEPIQYFKCPNTTIRSD